MKKDSEDLEQHHPLSSCSEINKENNNTLSTRGKRPGPSFSKLTMLVNVTMKFQTLISNVRHYFFLEKCEKNFSHFFQQKCKGIWL